MPCNCAVSGLNELFDDRVARNEARRFRKKGLPLRSRKLINAIQQAVGLEGKTSLEVGAGIGAVTVTLLQRGVTRASIVDASMAYVATARDLATNMGLAERLEIANGDFVEIAGAMQAVDVVVMDRVVCCYPAWQDLIEAATQKAGRAIAFTWPRDVWWNRVGTAVINAFLRMRNPPFRVFVHPTQQMRALLESRGLSSRVAGYRGPWEVVIAVRSSA
jgi:magnesium-protoporphyrin O-methyltransferase